MESVLIGNRGVRFQRPRGWVPECKTERIETKEQRERARAFVFQLCAELNHRAAGVDPEHERQKAAAFGLESQYQLFRAATEIRDVIPCQPTIQAFEARADPGARQRPFRATGPAQRFHFDGIRRARKRELYLTVGLLSTGGGPCNASFGVE